MRDAGGQLSDALEFLCLPELHFQAPAFGDVSSGDDEPGLITARLRNAQNLQAQKAGLALPLVGHIVTAINRRGREPARDFCFHLRVQPSDAAVLNRPALHTAVIDAEGIGRGQAPAGDAALEIHPDQDGRDRAQKQFGFRMGGMQLG